MTDFSNVRGAYESPEGGVDLEFAPEAVKRWGRSVMERPISVGLPGMYFTPGQDEQGRRRIFKTPEAPEGAATFDPMMGLITEGQMISKGVQFARTRALGREVAGWPKRAAKEVMKTDIADIKAGIKTFPAKMWDRVDDFMFGKRHPELGNVSGAMELVPGLSRELDQYTIWLNSRYANADTLVHEGSHVASKLFGEWAETTAKQGGPFARLRGVWGHMKRDAMTLEGAIGNKNPQLVDRLYQYNPEEIFARRFTEAVDEGMGFSEATKIAVHEVRANMKISRDVIEESINWLNKKGAGIPMPRYWGK